MKPNQANFFQAAEVSAPNPPLLMAIDAVADELHELELALQTLEQKVGPVLMSPGPVAGATTLADSPCPGSSSAVTMIWDHKLRIATHRRAILEIAKRLES